MKSLKSIRSRQKFTQADLARSIGVTQGVVSEWESGKYLPGITNAIVLARVLGCSVEELFAETQADKVSQDKSAETK